MFIVICQSSTGSSSLSDKAWSWRCWFLSFSLFFIFLSQIFLKIFRKYKFFCHFFPNGHLNFVNFYHSLFYFTRLLFIYVVIWFYFFNFFSKKISNIILKSLKKFILCKASFFHKFDNYLIILAIKNSANNNISYDVH